MVVDQMLLQMLHHPKYQRAAVPLSTQTFIMATMHMEEVRERQAQTGSSDGKRNNMIKPWALKATGFTNQAFEYNVPQVAFLTEQVTTQIVIFIVFNTVTMKQDCFKVQ